MLKISRCTVLLILLIVSAFAGAESRCQRAAELSDGVYQEVSGSSGFACIFSQEGSVVLSFLSKNGSRKWIRNTVLVDKDELSSGVVSLAVSNGVDLIFEYPRDVYVVAFSLDKNVIREARHVMRVPSVDPEGMVSEIVLRTKQDVLAHVGMDTASKDALFGGDALELVHPQNVAISSRKANLKKVARGKATGMYLVRGDEVKLVGYEDGWVRLEYVTAKGRRISMWTELSNVL